MDEQIIWNGKPNWKGYAGVLTLFAFLGLISLMNGSTEVFIFALLLTGIVAAVRMQYTFTITSQRIIARKGIIAKSTGELDIKDIRSINVKQSIMQRLFKIGSLEFTTASGPAKEVSLIHIPKVEELKEKIRSLKVV